jgi:hypothetical protein
MKTVPCKWGGAATPKTRRDRKYCGQACRRMASAVLCRARVAFRRRVAAQARRLGLIA